MIATMLFWHRKGESLSAALEPYLSGAKAVNGDDPEQLKEVVSLAKTMLAAKENAHRCAVDAAPYCHPKLQSIALTGGDGGPVQVVTRKMTPAEAQQAYQLTLKEDVKEAEPVSVERGERVAA